MLIGDIIKYNQELSHIRSIISVAEDRIESQTGCYVKLKPVLQSADLNNDDFVDTLINELLYYWNVDIKYLIAKSRKTDAVIMRQIVYMTVKKWFPKYSLENIGKKLNRDHTTVMHGIESGYGFIETNDRKFMKYYLPVQHIIDEVKA